MLHVDQNRHLYSSRARNIYISKILLQRRDIVSCIHRGYNVNINHSFIVCDPARNDDN